MKRLEFDGLLILLQRKKRKISNKSVNFSFWEKSENILQKKHDDDDDDDNEKLMM